MRKLYLFVLAACIVSTTFVSCRKDVVQSETIKEYTIDTTIASGSIYHLDLSSVFTPGKKATIIDQPHYFTINTIDTLEGAVAPEYTYSSSAPAGTIDNLTLAISDLDDGTRKVSKDSTILYLNITIR